MSYVTHVYQERIVYIAKELEIRTYVCTFIHHNITIAPHHIFDESLRYDKLYTYTYTSHMRLHTNLTFLLLIYWLLVYHATSTSMLCVYLIQQIYVTLLFTVHAVV